MTFTTLKNDKLKISLDRLETLQLFGGADNIDRNDPATRFAIKLLFKRALRENYFRPGSGSVFVEIVKTLAGGCEIYFIKNRGCLSGEETGIPFVFEFLNCENAVRAARVLSAVAGRSAKSRFFRLEDRYRLTVSAKKPLLLRMTEFADAVYTSPVQLAFTEEYGKELIDENAVEILSKL